MINLSILGLSIVSIAWIIQFFGMNKRREISKAFLITYVVGVLFLIVDAYNSKRVDIAIINAVALLLATGVSYKFSKPKM